MVFSWWEVSLEFWNLEGRRLKVGMGLWGFEDWNSGLLGVEAPMRFDHRSVAHDFLRLREKGIKGSLRFVCIGECEQAQTHPLSFFPDHYHGRAI